VARVALARRDLLLRVHSHRLGREDLEDCLSQATLELVARARSGAAFAGSAHIANALDQKLVSRIHDRRRALAGRSPIEAAMGRAASLDEPAGAAERLADHLADVEERVAARLELRRLREVAEELTDDQRLVLACQLALNMDCEEFCRRHGWSAEKFRKVAQRARARLARLVDEYGSGERCRRLESDLVAVVSRVADPRQRRRIAAHLANCPGCRARVRALRATERRVLALFPGASLTGKSLLGGKTVAAAATGALGAGGTCASTSGGALTATSASTVGVAGGMLGAAGASGAGIAVGSAPLLFGGVLGSVKLGLCTLCVTGLAGGVLLLGHREAHRTATRTSALKAVGPGRSLGRARAVSVRSGAVPSAQQFGSEAPLGSARPATRRGGRGAPGGGGGPWLTRTPRRVLAREFVAARPAIHSGVVDRPPASPASIGRTPAATFEGSGRLRGTAGPSRRATPPRSAVPAEFRRAP